MARCQINAFAVSVGSVAYRPGNTTTSLRYATAVPTIEAVLVPCEQEPGIIYLRACAYTSSDLRRLQGEKHGRMMKAYWREHDVSKDS